MCEMEVNKFNSETSSEQQQSGFSLDNLNVVGSVIKSGFGAWNKSQEIKAAKELKITEIQSKERAHQTEKIFEDKKNERDLHGRNMQQVVQSNIQVQRKILKAYSDIILNNANNDVLRNRELLKSQQQNQSSLLKFLSDEQKLNKQHENHSMNNNSKIINNLLNLVREKDRVNLQEKLLETEQTTMITRIQQASQDELLIGVLIIMIGFVFVCIWFM